MEKVRVESKMKPRFVAERVCEIGCVKFVHNCDSNFVMAKVKEVKRGVRVVNSEHGWEKGYFEG